MIYKIAVIAFVLLYFGVALIGRSWILYRNTGINPFKTLGRQGIQGINERALVFGACLVPMIAFFYLMPYDLYKFMGPIEYLEIPLVQNIGIVLMLLGRITHFLFWFLSSSP